MRTIDADKLLQKLDDRPSDAFISIHALKTLINESVSQEGMTLEKIKEEARKQGYALHKRQKYIPLLPCPICGKRPRQWFTNMGTVWYGCKDQRTESLKHDKMAREAWNRMVKE